MRRRKGFTLVELLVVIGIIIFIATVFIYPAYERMKRKATEVVCVSNLRQIGQALLMYAQDHDGFVPPYCNVDTDLKLTSLKAQRWKNALDPYIRDKNVFFCPEDPFAGLPPEKTPCQGLPECSADDFFYSRTLDHSITSYLSGPGLLIEGEEFDIEDWFKRGYYLTTDIYHNMRTLPLNWLYAPLTKDGLWHWTYSVVRLHEVTIFARDYTHFLLEGWIELFYDGSVDFHTSKRHCYIWRQLEEYYKPKTKEGEGNEAP